MSLFDDAAAGVPEQHRDRTALIEAYAAELLKRPPVRSLAPKAPDRDREAKRLATKDVDRLLKAADAAGLMLARKED